MPLALVDSGTRGIVITAINGSAAAAGVAVGQSLADARAALPVLHTRPAQPANDHAALEELTRWAGRYGPLRNIEGRDAIWVDISGVDHLFGGEAHLLSDLQRCLKASGFTCRLGLADTGAAAWALARFGHGPISMASQGSTKTALEGLPVEALRLTPQTVLLLRRLGLYRIGQLYSLPRASLARRFREVRGGGGTSGGGLADAVVLRLDQALGGIREPRPPLMVLPCRVARQVFAEPLVTSAGIETAVEAAMAALCALLADAGEGVRQLRLTLYRTDSTYAATEIGTSSPSRDKAHLSGLLGEKLAGIDLGFGVDVVSLEAIVVAALDATQAGLGAKPRRLGAQGLAQLVDRLANRVGTSSIYQLAAVPSHIPEQAECRMPVSQNRQRLDDKVDGLSCATKPPRPPFLLSRPEAITVIAEVPEGPPRQFLWRRASHRIIKAEGPERIAPAWWQGIGVGDGPSVLRPRDYYRIEDDHGGRYWVFREGVYGSDADDRQPVWYVHGLFG